MIGDTTISGFTWNYLSQFRGSDLVAYTKNNFGKEETCFCSERIWAVELSCLPYSLLLFKWCLSILTVSWWFAGGRGEGVMHIRLAAGCCMMIGPIWQPAMQLLVGSFIMLSTLLDYSCPVQLSKHNRGSSLVAHICHNAKTIFFVRADFMPQQSGSGL